MEGAFPFRGLAVAFEFLLYGGLLSIYCINEQKALVLPEDGELMAMALLTFFAIAFAKIGWWAMKTFVLEESSE
ncbi:MAG: hypothetical protein A2Z34_06355 [Planctomycetes bacterium RBG_16_59_8]|nr:MAG: hypothetical protein A2Z34_06355 [Planctomycetes bacterium RBG_16_59_8]